MVINNLMMKLRLKFLHSGLLVRTSLCFSNGALNSEGGTPITGAKTAFTRTINTLSKGEFDADMIRKGWCIL